jgi:glycine oxidase
MTAIFDVIVVGAGAVGAACARELAVTGRRVLVLDRGTPDGEAWRAAAGMLAPQIEAVPEDPLFELGLAGRERYGLLAPELLSSTGIDIGLWQSGIAHLALNEPSAADLRLSVSLQRQQGHHCDWLDATEVRAQWPWLGPSQGALWAPREGALDPVRLVEALLADAKVHGAVVVQDQVVRLEQAGGKLTGVRGRDFYAAPNAVIAAGAWSGAIVGMPRPLSVEPVRGQMAALPWPLGVPPAIVYNRDCYLVYRDGEALIGSTMEYAGFDHSTTPQGIERIHAAVTALYPQLGSLTIRRTWAGLRPVSPDGRPIVGAEPRLKGLWYATGHGRNGILLAGITGVIIRELLDGEDPREEMDALRADRFWRW